jgi:hypothetical protein
MHPAQLVAALDWKRIAAHEHRSGSHSRATTRHGHRFVEQSPWHLHPAYLMREAIRGHQRSSEVIQKGHLRSSEVIRGALGGAIRGHPGGI